jgi:uncharacterized membrane protein
MTTLRRSLEIDLARVTALLLMIAYHVAYDLRMIYGENIDIFSGIWWWIGKASAILFLLLVGMSFAISWNRTPQWPKYIRRGVRIFCYGLVVTLSTYLYDPSSYVRFGILHLIGLSVILLPLFVRLGYLNIALGFLCLWLGTIVGSIRGAVWSLPFGLMPSGFFSVDYYPVFPWFGYVLLGTALGKYFIARNQPTVFRSPGRWGNLVTGVSRHSLLIYMLHQPLLILFLWFMSRNW